MTNIRRLLSKEERAEYDSLFFSAKFYDDGTARPSHEIGDRMHELLLDAIQAGRLWAQWVMDDNARSGHIKALKAWDRQRQPVSTKVGDQIVKRSSVQAVKRLDQETKAMFWEDTKWVDMSPDDLAQIINGSEQRIQSSKEVAGIARSLLALVNSTGAKTVAEALQAKGVSIDDYLTGSARDAA